MCVAQPQCVSTDGFLPSAAPSRGGDAKEEEEASERRSIAASLCDDESRSLSLSLPRSVLTVSAVDGRSAGGEVPEIGASDVSSRGEKGGRRREGGN